MTIVTTEEEDKEKEGEKKPSFCWLHCLVTIVNTEEEDKEKDEEKKTSFHWLPCLVTIVNTEEEDKEKDEEKKTSFHWLPCLVTIVNTEEEDKEKDEEKKRSFCWLHCLVTIVNTEEEDEEDEKKTSFCWLPCLGYEASSRTGHCSVSILWLGKIASKLDLQLPSQCGNTSKLSNQIKPDTYNLTVAGVQITQRKQANNQTNKCFLTNYLEFC